MKSMDTPHNKLVTLTVNGRTLQALPGKSILKVLLEAGIHVPHLCYDARLKESLGHCGVCVVQIEDEDRFVQSCQTPVRDGMVITTSNPALEHYRRIRFEQILSDHNADCVAPCQQACPAGIDIQAYLHQVANGNFGAALRIIKDRNPLPAICGRVCPHPCEAACRRSLVDSPVAINAVKRFVADQDRDAQTPFVPEMKTPSGRRIAIVGAGPSGLSAAWYSALAGHQVTLYDQHEKAGGMLRYGIPDYRLQQEILDQEIKLIFDLGVKFVPRRRLGVKLRLEDLQDLYDAVYLAIGSWQPTQMGIDGETLPGIWAGIRYLEEVARGKLPRLGDKVVVVGGGNTAIDCARTALRAGAAQVRILYRRGREEMPADPHEIEDAIKEGVEMIFLAAPLRIEVHPERVGEYLLYCTKMRLGKPDRSGRRRPEPIEGSEERIEASSIIGAIGQRTDTSYLWDDLPVKLNRWGDIQVDSDTLQSSADKIFAGGDCVTGPATVVQAVAAGHRAAEAMDEYIQTGAIRPTAQEYACNRGSLEDLPRFEFESRPKIPRAATPTLPEELWGRSFAEVALGLAEESAVREAGRCLECGCSARYDCHLRQEAAQHGVEHKPPIRDRYYKPVVEDHPFITRDPNKCISCGRCVAACTEVAGPDVLGFYLKHGKLCVGTKSGLPLAETDCVSCGQCVNACPCGALEYKRESDAVFQALNRPETLVIGFVAPAVRTVIARHFGLAPEEASPYMAGLLKKMGFDKVFDFVFAADLTILEETSEFLARLESGGRLPQFTSCCPGWVNLVEKRYPELIPLLSTCKSPQQMMGATVKQHYLKWAGIEDRDVFVVSVVPCLAKKQEAAREEFAPGGVRDVDAVLTTTELLEMIEVTKIDTDHIAPAAFDDPYRRVSGAGMLFGATGGVAEAALRMAAEKVDGSLHPDHLEFKEMRGLESIKTATVRLGDRDIRLAVVSGLANVEPLLERIRAGEATGYDLVEVMACPGGCIAGAGNPAVEDLAEYQQRQAILTAIDASAPVRTSQANPDVLRLYKDFYGSPNSACAKEHLHTHYQDKRRKIASAPTQKAESAYQSREIQVCVERCCFERGATTLLKALQEKAHALRMDHFLRIQPALIYGHSETQGVFVTLDGKKIDPELLDDLDAFLMRIVKSA